MNQNVASIHIEIYLNKFTKIIEIYTVEEERSG